MSSTDKLTDFAIATVNKAIDAAAHVLPVATKYVLEVTAINCALDVAQTGVLVVGTGIGLWTWNKYPLKWFKKAIEEDRSEGLIVGSGLVTILGAIGLLIACISSVVSILGIGWSVVGMFHPDLYIVHKALERV